MFTLILAVLICLAAVAASESIRWYLRRLIDADTRTAQLRVPVGADVAPSTAQAELAAR